MVIATDKQMWVDDRQRWRLKMLRLTGSGENWKH